MLQERIIIKVSYIQNEMLVCVFLYITAVIIKSRNCSSVFEKNFISFSETKETNVQFED